MIHANCANTQKRGKSRNQYGTRNEELLGPKSNQGRGTIGVIVIGRRLWGWCRCLLGSRLRVGFCLSGGCAGGWPLDRLKSRWPFGVRTRGRRLPCYRSLIGSSVRGAPWEYIKSDVPGDCFASGSTAIARLNPRLKPSALNR